MQTVDISKDQVKAMFLALVGSLFDEGIIPSEWVRANGDKYEKVEISDMMQVLVGKLSGELIEQ